jgi:pyoverdine/dityrosine biosynthesis protein Dit1
MEVLNEIGQQAITQIVKELLRIGNFEQTDLSNIDIKSIPICKRLLELYNENKKLTFILPAFPAKSSNPNKTSGVLPDMGEFIALQNLNDFCENITKIYSPGAEIIICSDGKVFNDLVFVEDENLKLYKNKIKSIIKIHRFSHLKTFDLEDYYNCDTPDSMRQLFCSEYAEDINNLKEQVLNDDHTKSLFNGIHRFIKEDFKEIHQELSNNQVHKQSKIIAYNIIRRSRAWDQLLKNVYPDTLRLSIHPYPIEHHKFGIKLVPSSDKWATPWHNIVVKKNSTYHLMKKKEALDLGYLPKVWEGEYVYFERT